MYVSFYSACMQMTRVWMRCCPTAGRRHIPIRFSLIGSKSPEPEPLAHAPAVLIVEPAVSDPGHLLPANLLANNCALPGPRCPRSPTRLRARHIAAPVRAWHLPGGPAVTMDRPDAYQSRRWARRQNDTR